MNPSIPGSKPGRLFFFFQKLNRRQFKRSMIFFFFFHFSCSERDFYKTISSCTHYLGQHTPFSHHGKTASWHEKKANRSECSGNLQIREALWGTIHSIDTSSGEGINVDWSFHTFPSEIQDTAPAQKVLTRLQWTTLTDALFGER